MQPRVNMCARPRVYLELQEKFSSGSALGIDLEGVGVQRVSLSLG